MLQTRVTLWLDSCMLLIHLFCQQTHAMPVWAASNTPSRLLYHRRVRGELRTARRELDDITSEHRATVLRIQQLEEQAQDAVALRAKVNRLAAQVRATDCGP